MQHGIDFSKADPVGHILGLTERVQYLNNQFIIAFLKTPEWVQYSNNEFINVILRGTFHFV